MKKLLLAFMALTLFACSSDDSTPATSPPVEENPNPENPNPVEQCNNAYVGNVELKTQAEVDAFGAKNYCSIIGNLIIGDFGMSSNITDLSGLSELREITFALQIFSNPHLETLHGLENLEKFMALTIYDNYRLQTLEHLESLKEAGPYGDTQNYVQIVYNSNLTSLKGLDKIENMQRLQIQRNALLDLKGLEGLKKLGSLDISQEDIVDMKGLEGLEKADEIVITGIDHLATLAGLDNVREVGRLTVQSNPELVSVAQIANFTTFSNFFCIQNDMLVTLPALNSAVTEMNVVNLIGNFTSLQGFSGLTKIMNLSLSSSSITSLQGLENVATVSGLRLYASNLTSLAALSNLTAIIDHSEEFSNEFEGIEIGYTGLTSLVGLEHITNFNGQFKFTGNANLANYCAISSIVNASTSFSAQLNAYNPTAQDIVAGNCSQ